MPEISSSRYLVQAGERVEASSKNAHWHKVDRLKRCIMCERDREIAAFTAYRYTTNQGKVSTRYESRCKDCSNARRRARYVAEGEKERAQCAAWREANRLTLRAYNAEMRKDPRYKALKAKAQRLRKARLRSGQGDSPEIRAIYAEAIEVERIIADCPLFDIPELGKKIHVDHIVPLSKGGLHHIDNLQLLPIGLNMRKGARCPK